MASAATLPVLIVTVIWALAVLLLGYYSYRRTSGGLRRIAVFLLVAAAFIAARIILQSVRLLFDLGFLVQFIEQAAIVIGLIVMSIASVRIRRITKEGR